MDGGEVPFLALSHIAHSLRLDISWELPEEVMMNSGHGQKLLDKLLTYFTTITVIIKLDVWQEQPYSAHSHSDRPGGCSDVLHIMEGGTWSLSCPY